MAGDCVRVVFVFIDGFGLGWDDPEINPLAVANLPTWQRLLGGRSLNRTAGKIIGSEASMVPTDATLGVPGFPQSATGQTALITGINAAQILGRHHNAYPPPTLKEIISQHSVLKKVEERGLKATFANMFTEEYFSMVEEGKLKNSVTTEATLAAGIPLRRKTDLLARRAVYQDITNQTLQKRGYAELPTFTPQESGQIVGQLARDYHFTLFEYFRTDMVGHSQNWDWAVESLELLDTFFASILAAVDLNETLVVLTSDHGNIEDLSVKTHTANPVPTLLVGHRQGQVAGEIKTLTDVVPALLKLWG